MKKKISTILIITLLISNLSFIALWQYEKRSKKDVLVMRNIGIHDCLEGFLRYRETGWEGSYNYALGGLSQVLSTSSFLNQKTSTDMYIMDLYYIYGIFASYPEVGKEYINEMIEIFDMLKNDINNLDAHTKINYLKSELHHK